MSWVAYAFGLPFIIGGIGRAILGWSFIDSLFPVLFGLNLILFDILLLIFENKKLEKCSTYEELNKKLEKL